MGALNFDRVEPEVLIVDGKVQGIGTRQKNRAGELIEDFMIAANGVMARAFSDAKVSSIRRVVKTPERWPRIVDLAKQHGVNLPQQPDARALNVFLQKRRSEDPAHYSDLSLAVIKLMGPGEYVLLRPGDPGEGHFSDLVTQRLIKALMAKQSPSYAEGQLASIAQNCTLREDAARSVERAMHKRIAAVALRNQIGKTFSAVVTGVTPKGVFVRILNPPAEGLLAQGADGVDVGDRLQVKLLSTNPQRGYIDFGR